ncbi:hypothetical protein [Bacteroides pyogenes]|uniref:hypothetical protein n=1 Tax=Bacteroides pyogenes TaxID=310300 RepID=UPI00373510A6
MRRYLILLIPLFLFTGCKTKYIPVERVSIEYRDRERIDSIHVKDSVIITQKGDTVYSDRWHYFTRFIFLRDTISNVERIPVPYEVEKIVYVEKKLSWWQRFVLWSGKVAWAIAIAILIFFTNKKFKWLIKIIRLIK